MVQPTVTEDGQTATVECVLSDWLRAAIEYLEAAARVTDGDLRRRFERN